MKKMCRAILLVTGAAVFWGGGCVVAFAQSAGAVFGHSDDQDVAHAWLGVLFRGDKLPDDLSSGAANLDGITEALHRALGLYSTGILVVAALLLFYNLAVLVGETAHFGVAFGRRSAQLWAPFRLIVALAFLVPVSGGLNAGQYLVAWMAGEGSDLASNVWAAAVTDMKGSMSGLALPRGPDVTGYVAGGLEMELCRGVYRRIYNAEQGSAAVRGAGPINDIEKIPRTRFAEETWQYTNRLHESIPLCGAYRFASVRAPDEEATGVLDRLGNDLADFSRSQTDKLIAATEGLAESNVSVLLGETAGGVHDDVVSLIASNQAALDDRMHALVAHDPAAVDRTLDDSAHGGWITAGGIMLELARLQQMYGTLAAHALPAVQAPALTEGDFLHPPIADAISADPLLHTYAAEEIAPLTGFYAQMQRTMHLARLWLYDRQLADLPIVLANPFDLRDQMDEARDPEAVSSLFGHVFNDAANSYGVWNRSLPPASALAPAGDRTLLAVPVAAQSAIATLAEFGRRQAAFGNYLFGIAGPDIAPRGTLVYSLLMGAAGLCFMASGFALMFLVPLLPFLRFFLGILAWLLSVVEAIVAIPLVALAHLNFSGEGLSGNAARHAYLLWLNILVRPVLTLFGFMAGLLLFTLGIIFLGLIFDQLTRLAAPTQGTMFVAVNVALTFLYTVLALAAANAAFKGITILPELAFKWLGGFIMLPAERAAEAPGAAANQPAAALPNYMGGSSLSGPRGIAGDRGIGDSRSMAEARALGLRSGLFPNYRGDEKPDAGALKEIAHLDKATESQSRAAGELPREAATTRIAIDAERRDIQKPARNRAENPNSPAGKKDVPSVDKNIGKADIVKSNPIREDPDRNS